MQATLIHDGPWGDTRARDPVTFRLKLYHRGPGKAAIAVAAPIAGSRFPAPEDLGRVATAIMLRAWATDRASRRNLCWIEDGPDGPHRVMLRWDPDARLLRVEGRHPVSRQFVEALIGRRQEPPASAQAVPLMTHLKPSEN